ncbi:MAG: TaqI-like C-terminal specificity domain-containing protein [Melioribacteraceae bacterium]
MTREQAISLIKTTFEDRFNEEKFRKFILEIFKDNYEKIDKEFYGNYIPEAYREFVQSYKRLLKYEFNKERIDVLLVELKRGISVERARSKQRNFVRDYLMGKFGSDSLKDAALVAFYTDDYEDWRFSFVKVEWKFDEQKNKIRDEATPAKRYSFLVGENEKSHTAQKQLLPLLESPEEITVKKLEEAFEIETVTKEFFEYYRELFIGIKLELDEIIKRDERIRNEFISKNIDTVNFAKKLLGQIVFLYFLQKKGWFGIGRDARWGDGPKNFLRRLFNKEYSDYQNFFNDILEPLFYEALRVDRSYNDHYYDKFHCRIPFLNGGLFDPINNYDWVHTDILLPNELFSNSSRTREGDIGNGVLDIFDRYNFTINEEEPLEKEVALDPELLGKIYEKLNAIRSDNFDEYVKVLKSGKKGDESKFNKEYGVYYTPREIVHYMCQESLINYLCSTDILVCDVLVCDVLVCENPDNSGVNVCKKEDIEKFVKYADLFLENERTAIKKKEKIEKGEIKSTKYEHRIPESIIQNAETIDKLLSNVKICDPAVGSGAFPIGMMHEIVKLRQLLSLYKSNAGISDSECNVGILACECTDKNVCNPVDTDKNVCDTLNLDISSGDLHITRRNLPHWTKPGSIYWVTFRLVDSLPKEKINQWKEEYEIWLKNNHKPWNSKQWSEYNEKFGERFEKWLDSGYGSCILARPEIREKLKECLFRFDKERFLLHAVVIMPNHVHLLIEPFSGYSLSEILKGIKGTSANYINKLLNTTGKTVWMEESYDHIVRNEKEYLNFLRYIIENPTKANLTADRYYIYILETMPNVTQTFMSVEGQTRMSLQPDVTQSFLPVDGQTRMSLQPDVTQSFLPVDGQTKMSLQPDVTQSFLPVDGQTRMSVLPYELKRHCIENSLYGVDIDPGAVEICKLRFWLSLIVDEEEFQNIKPLPNLDYKVVQGDSLLEVEKDLFNNEAFYNLELLKHHYFKETNPLQKQKIKKQIDNLILKISKGHTQFDFEVYFSEVFHQKGGFDIVIANPPYVQLQKNHGQLAERYKTRGYKTFDRMGDIYCLFYEKGINILRKNGILCFISSNKWMRAGYGEKLRGLLTEYNPLILVDLGPGIFESATVDTNILLVQKKRTDRFQLKGVTLTKDNPEKIDIAEQLSSRGTIITKLTKDAWFIGSSAEQQLKEKIERIGKPLKDWDIKIYRGIVTGLNEAFIITTEKRNEILTNCKDEDERLRTEAIIKPILRGRDIKRYYYEWAGLWVIGTFPALHLNIEEYPALKKYFFNNFDIRQLEQSGKKYPKLGFDARKKTGNKWFETQDQIAYYPEFEKEKVVYGQFQDSAEYCYCEAGIYLSSNEYLIGGNYNRKYFLGLLNSKLIEWYLKSITGVLGTGMKIGQKSNFEKIPLPPITSANLPIVKQIEALVDKILAVKKENPQADTSQWEGEIDRLVYQLYDLTEEEIKIIEGAGYG